MSPATTSGFTSTSSALAGPFGGTIAHSFLTLSPLPTLMQELLSVTGVRLRVNYGLNRVRFPAPLPVGSTVRGYLVIDEAAEVENSVQLLATMTVEVKAAGKPAASTRWCHGHGPYAARSCSDEGKRQI
jgi:acyl dehydratase